MNPQNFDKILKDTNYLNMATSAGISALPIANTVFNNISNLIPELLPSMEQVYKDYLERESITYVWEDQDKANTRKEAALRALEQLRESNPELFV